MTWRFVPVAGLVLACAACSTVSDESEEARFLPPLPSLPSMPTMSISDISIPGTGREAPVIDPSLEAVIYWRVIEDDILVIHANTQGCTSRADFDVSVKQYHEDIYTVSISREDMDRCVDEIPWGIQLGFGFEELGVPHGGQVVVLNPLDDRAWDWNPYAGRRQMAAR